MQVRVHLDRYGVLQVFGSGFGYPLGHGGGHECGLAFRGSPSEDCLDVAGEAPVQHLVGFIQHHESHGPQVEGALTNVVQGTARRANDYVGSALQRSVFRLYGPAAVKQRDPQAPRRGQGCSDFSYLNCQFPSGYQYKGLNLRRRWVALLHHWYGECEGLAGACPCLAYQVAPFQQVGDRLLLYGRGLGNVHPRNRPLRSGLQGHSGKYGIHVLVDIFRGFIDHHRLANGGLRHPTRGVTMSAEARAAVDGPVGPREEGDGGGCFTVGAFCRVAFGVNGLAGAGGHGCGWHAEKRFLYLVGWNSESTLVVGNNAVGQMIAHFRISRGAPVTCVDQL